MTSNRKNQPLRSGNSLPNASQWLFTVLALALLSLLGCGHSSGTTGDGAGGATSTASTNNGTAGSGATGMGGATAGGGGIGGSTVGPEPVAVPWEAEFNLPPQDAAGFSMFTPSADSRIVYVSATDGDDGSGTVYDKDSAEVGPDPFLPSASVKAFKTAAQALSQLRPGFPDWVLFKRGDVWNISTHLEATSGRSASERSLIGTYGDAKERPLIRTGANMGLRFWRDIRYSAVVGLAFYAQQRDPENPEFVGFQNIEPVSGFSSYADDETAPNQTILLEDCSFSFFSNNTIQGSSPTRDFVVRRCQFLNNYSTTSHSQGMYTKDASVLLEENFFDHNGWYKQSYIQPNDQAEGQATIFNHNTYFTHTRNTIFRRNIFLRASSINNKFTANPPGTNDEVMAENILLDNNLYVDGEIGISAGGNTDNDNGHRWRNIQLMHNVLLDLGRSRPTARSLGWGIEVKDWDGGTVAYNYFVHYGSANVANIFALHVLGHTRDVDILGNVMHGLQATRYAMRFDDRPKSNIVVADNELQFKNSGMRLIDSAYLDAGAFKDNRYFSDDTAAPFKAADDAVDYASWQSTAQDEGSSFTELAYVDPGRTVESYMLTQGKEASLQAFIAEAKAQSKHNWRPAYTAAVINNYVRQGYALSQP